MLIKESWKLKAGRVEKELKNSLVQIIPTYKSGGSRFEPVNSHKGLAVAGLFFMHLKSLYYKLQKVGPELIGINSHKVL